MKKPLKHAFNRMLSLAFSEPLAPITDYERELIKELQTTFSSFPVLDTTTCPPSEKAWLTYMNDLRELVLTEDPQKFLCWNIILKTMFVAHASYVGTELNYLKRRPDWEHRWKEVIQESQVGFPVPYWRYPRSSGNLIHHAYHIAQFEEKTELAVSEVAAVFEFGGGYGSMCRLLFKAGFKGKYVIFDLPAFSALQRFYLKSLNIPVHSRETFPTAQNGVLCISNLKELEEILTDSFEVKKAIFLATWSLSETPVDLRDSILPLINSFNAFLIAYQHQFKEVDNVQFFKVWKGQYQDIQWHNWQIEHLPGHYYLVGQRQTAG